MVGRVLRGQDGPKEKHDYTLINGLRGGSRRRVPSNRSSLPSAQIKTWLGIMPLRDGKRN